MALNAITTTDAAVLIPEIWANMVLENLRENIVLTRLVWKNSDIRGGFSKGDTLHIPSPGTLTANDKAADTAVTVQKPTTSEVTVTLDKHKEVTFAVEDITRAMSSYDILRMYTAEAGAALAKQIEQDLFAEYTNAGASIGTAGTDLSASTLRLLRKTFLDNNVPLRNLHLVMSTKDGMALLGDSELMTWYAYQNKSIPDGAIANIYGFTLWESQLVPVVAGTPNTTYNLAFAPDAIVLAMRAMPEPPASTGANVRTAVVRDPESGIVVRVVVSYNADYLATQVTCDVLYGIKTIQPTKLVAVLS